MCFHFEAGQSNSAQNFLLQIYTMTISVLSAGDTLYFKNKQTYRERTLTWGYQKKGDWMKV